MVTLGELQIFKAQHEHLLKDLINTDLLIPSWDQGSRIPTQFKEEFSKQCQFGSI